MTFQGPDPSDGSDRRLFIGLGVTAVAVVIAAVVVIVLVSHSNSTRSQRVETSTRAQSSAGSGSAATVPATVTAPHVINPTASATSTTPPTSGALEPVGGPVPSGFQPESFTAISDQVWWVLGTASCGSPPCTSIVRTADGGASFVGIPAPRTDKVTGLRFANSQDGYAYGTQLWSTQDGGATWSPVTAVSGSVQSLAISGGYVYASTGTGLLRATVGGDQWTRVGAGTNPWAQGDEVLADDADNGGALLISADGGTSFQSHPAPSGTVGCSFETTGDGVIWAPCATGMLSAVWRSTDGGAQWTMLDASGGETGNPQPNSAPFAAASADTAVYGADALFRTTDGGSSWTAVTGFPPAHTEIAYLGFTDPIHGVAIVDSDAPNQASTAQLEVTDDGGASYSPVKIAPG